MDGVHAENKMSTMPVKKLLITVATPMMISMLVQALYNIVDSMFVAKLSQDALAAVSLAFSMQNLMIAVAVGTGVGVNSFLSKSLGEKDFETSNTIAGNSVVLAFITYIVFAVFGLFGIKKFFMMQTGDPTIVKYGIEYLQIVVLGSIGVFVQICMERLLTSTGKTFYSMIIQVVGAVTNIILDPIMIFGYLGCPAMGVRGAAIATVTGQVVACIVGAVLNLTKNKELVFNIKYFKLKKEIVKRIYSVAIPTIVMQSLTSVMVFGFNKILVAFSTAAIAVFGVYIKLQSFVFMPVFGLNNGVVPIVSYNYGARSRERIVETIKFGLTLGVSIMFLGLLLFELVPEQLFSMFKSGNSAEDAEMIEMGIKALRIIAIHFPLAGISIVFTAVFQALGTPIYSLFISIIRQLIVLLPAAYLLSLSGNVNLIWFSFPIAELTALVLSIIFFRKAIKLIDFEKNPKEKIIDEIQD